MKRRISRIGVMFVVLLTAMFSFFAAPVSAVTRSELERNSVRIYLDEPYTYKNLNSNRPYLKFTIPKNGTYGVVAVTKGIGYSDTVYIFYDESGNEIISEFSTDNYESRIGQHGSLMKSYNMKAGTYYFWQRPLANKASTYWGPNAISVVKIFPLSSSSSEPTPAPATSPKINKVNTGNKKAWIYWNKVDNATSYRVYVIQNGKERLAGATEDNKFLITDMTNYVKAEYYVKAAVNGRLTSEKNKAYSTPRNGVKPTVTPAANNVSLKWSAYNGATQYKVVLVDNNNKVISNRVTKGTAFNWKGLPKGGKYGFYIQPYVGKDYIPFGRSYAEDRANIVHFTAK